MTNLEPDVSMLVNSTGVGLTNRPIFSTTSPDNPLLPLNAQEYLTLKRFANERKLPQRFKNLPGNSTAHENSLYAPREASTANPLFKTTAGYFISSSLFKRIWQMNSFWLTILISF